MFEVVPADSLLGYTAAVSRKSAAGLPDLHRLCLTTAAAAAGYRAAAGSPEITSKLNFLYRFGKYIFICLFFILCYVVFQ